MTWGPETAVDTLRRAWAEADRDEEPTGEGPSGIDAERIWRAVAGDLPPEEVHVLAAAAARDPEVARAWRLARELQAAMPERRRELGRLLRFPGLTPAVRWAAAAALAIALGTGLWVRLVAPEPTVDPGVRGTDTGAPLASALPDGGPLSRHDFTLRWAPLADPRARYTLQVTTEDLGFVAEAADLAVPQHRVPTAALAALPAGTRLLWQVDGRLPDGRVLSSTTATVVLAD